MLGKTTQLMHGVTYSQYFATNFCRFNGGHHAASCNYKEKPAVKHCELYRFNAFFIGNGPI